MFYFLSQHMTSHHCNFINYIQGVIGNTEAWTIASLALERYLCVCHPMSARKYRTRKATVLTLACIFICCILKNIHFFFTSDFFHNKASNHIVCVTGYFHIGSRNVVLDVFEMMFNSLLPFVFILIFNLLIIRRLQHQNRFRRSLKCSCADRSDTENRCADSSVTDHFVGITVMLVVVTFTFIFLTSPIFVFRAVSSYDKDSPLHEKARYVLYTSIFGILYDTNFAANFYLYCLTGRSFRNDLKQLFTSAKCAWNILLIATYASYEAYVIIAVFCVCMCV